MLLLNNCTLFKRLIGLKWILKNALKYCSLSSTTMSSRSLPLQTKIAQRLVSYYNFMIFRKILGHLYTIAEQCEKNLMPVYNLAPLWGPNILIVDGQVSAFYSILEPRVPFFALLMPPIPFLCFAFYRLLTNITDLSFPQQR